MSRPPPPPPGPTYYRLPEASWAMIRDEYLNGWSAKDIAKKWRVSTGSVYRHAGDGGWTKLSHGQVFHDRIVAAPAPVAPAAAAVHVTGEPSPHLGPAYAPDLTDDEEPMSPSQVADRAVEAAGRAVLAGQVGEAERLGRLAATMKKLSGRDEVGGGGQGRFQGEDGDEDDPRGRPKQCTLTCTPDACWKDELYEKLAKSLEEKALFLDVEGQHLAHDYVEMARSMGIHVPDEDQEALRRVLRAKTPEAIARAAYVTYGGAMAPLPEWAQLA